MSKYKAPTESTPETLRRAEEEGLNLEEESDRNLAEYYHAALPRALRTLL
ncbi:MAG: hypothetical protein ABSA11_17050 [Candidatus Bathyarchaeia archaeon]